MRLFFWVIILLSILLMSYGYGFNTINSNFYYEMGDLKEKETGNCHIM